MEEPGGQMEARHLARVMPSFAERSRAARDKVAEPGSPSILVKKKEPHGLDEELKHEV